MILTLAQRAPRSGNPFRDAGSSGCTLPVWRKNRIDVQAVAFHPPPKQQFGDEPIHPSGRTGVPDPPAAPLMHAAIMDVGSHHVRLCLVRVGRTLHCASWRRYQKNHAIWKCSVVGIACQQRVGSGIGLRDGVHRIFISHAAQHPFHLSCYGQAPWPPGTVAHAQDQKNGFVDPEHRSHPAGHHATFARTRSALTSFAYREVCAMVRGDVKKNSYRSVNATYARAVTALLQEWRAARSQQKNTAGHKGGRLIGPMSDRRPAYHRSFSGYG